MIGIAIGLYLFTALDSRTLAQGLGALILFYGLYSLWLTSRPQTRWQASPRLIAPLAGTLGRDVLVTVAIALPMMLVGIYIGNRIHTGISELAFRRLVSGALMVSGLALLLKSA